VSTAAASGTRRRRLFRLTALVAALMAAANAQAYFTANGNGAGNSNAGTLGAPTLSGTPGAGTATLTWSSVSPPASGSVSYYVKRNGGNPGGNCPTSAAPSAVLTCTDSGLAAGTYSYTVTAVWRTWTAASSPVTQVTLASGAFDHFVLSAATTTPTAGQSDNLTITAKDTAGNTVTAYGGSNNLTFSGASTIGSFRPTVTNSGGTATNFGSATAINFTNGVATVSGSSNGAMILYKVETANIVVSDGTHTNGAGLAITVGPAAVSSFTFPTPATQTAGTGFNVSITALDAYGNTATGYSGAKSVVFSGPANSPGGTAPSYPASVTFTSGVATTVPITLYNAASTTLTATEAGKSGSTGAFTVNPAGINLFSLAAATTTPTAGAADSLTITAKDAYGNTATGYSGSHSLTFSGASAIGTHNPTVTNSSGTAVNFGTATAVTFTNGVSSAGGVMRLYKSGAASITVAEGGSYTSNAVSVTVSSAPPSSFTVTNPGTRTAGTAFTVTLTASNDAYGNAPTSYAGTQCIAFSGPTASPNGTAPLYPQGSCPVGQSAVTFNASGVGTLAGVVLYDATNSTTLTATDTVNGVTGTSGAFTVNGLATMGSFVLTAATTTPTAGAADQLTIQAADVYGNSITSYTGQHTLTFSGAGMAGTVHPTVTDRTGTAVNFGTAESITFTNGASSAGGIMRLYRAGTAQIVVTDGTYNNGSGLAVTVSPATASGLALSATQAVVTPGEADNLTVRAIDAYGNTAPSYTGTHNLTFSGASVNGAQNPTVSNNSGTAVNFGTAESITFANGVSTVSGSSNGVMRLYKLETAHLVVTDGTYTSASLSIVVSNVTASMVSAGGFHTCALVAGTVECWGDNESGELGNNTTTNSSSPVMVKGVGGTGTLSGVTQISAGKYHTCALVSGSVYCWGENDYGELGNNSTTDSWTPVQVRLNATTYLTGVTQVSASGKFTCALLSTGTVRCWGHNQYGQLGNGNTNDSSIAVQVSGITNAIQVTNGANQACALLSDNTVKCWGYNNDGQLGDGSTTNRSTPVQVVGASGSGSLTGVSVVSGGRLHTCALLSGGTVYCWGDNGNGELGDGTTTNRSLPVRVGSITNASTISAGEYHSCAVLSDGTAQCWGASAYGQVGDGTTADTSTPVTVIGPGGWGSLTGIAAISAGGADINETDDYEHTCALTSDGTVVCWGQNNYGQLGNGTTTMSVSPVAVALL
jgi:alpha-tubulin suppressor-like RCC1 family protein